MKKAEIFFAILAILVLLPFLFTGIANARQVTYTQTFPGVTTGGGVTTANVILLKPLFGADVVYVTAITTTVGTDVPAVGTYTSASRTLQVIGLAESETRALEITYGYGRFDAYLDGFFANFHIFLIFALFVFVVIELWAQSRSRGRL